MVFFSSRELYFISYVFQFCYKYNLDYDCEKLYKKMSLFTQRKTSAEVQPVHSQFAKDTFHNIDRWPAYGHLFNAGNIKFRRIHKIKKLKNTMYCKPRN